MRKYFHDDMEVIIESGTGLLSNLQIFVRILMYEGDFKSLHSLCCTEQNYLFYKILLQAFNIIPIPLYDSFPMFGKSCIPDKTPSLC